MQRPEMAAFKPEIVAGAEVLSQYRPEAPTIDLPKLAFIFTCWLLADLPRPSTPPSYDELGVLHGVVEVQAKWTSWRSLSTSAGEAAELLAPALDGEYRREVQRLHGFGGLADGPRLVPLRLAEGEALALARVFVEVFDAAVPDERGGRPVLEQMRARMEALGLGSRASSPGSTS